MAGYKRTIIDMNPVWFFTFDSDRFITGVNTFEDRFLIDEMGNIDDAMIQNEHPLFTGYAAGMTGLVQPEVSDQYAVRFAANTRHPQAITNNVSLCPCSYFEIPYNHTGANQWTKDEMTFIFLMRKDPQPYDDWSWTGEVNNSPRVYRLDETIIRLGNIFEMGTTYQVGVSTTAWHRLFLKPDDTARVEINSHQSSNKLSQSHNLQPVTGGRASWVVLRYKNGIFEYIVDGNVIYEANIRQGGGYDPLLHTIPALMNLPPQGLQFEEMRTFIGGKPTNEIRVTTPKHQIVSKIEVDQVSLFNRYVTDDELSRLYRRVWFRDEMFKVENPYVYIPFNEKRSDLTSDRSIKILGKASKSAPLIMDNWQDVETDIDGMMLGEKALRFPENGVMLPYYPQTSSNLTDFFDYSKDFTFSFSFKGFTSKRAALFQAIEVSGATELSLFTNSNNGDFSIGWMDLRIGRNQTITFRADVADDKWHRITIRRTENDIDVWIDSELVVSGKRVVYRRKTPATAMLLNSHDHDTNTGGTLSELVVYDKSLSDIVLNAHISFDSLYRVKGIVQSEGQAIRAKVRIYSYKFANFLGETYSSSSDGGYQFDLATNESVVIMVLDESQTTVRVKTVAPVIPDVII